MRANELGYIVSKPTTDCCRYDMIIDTGNDLKRVQVKYCDGKSSSSTGVAVLSLRKYYINGKVKDSYNVNEIEALIVFVKPVNKLCYFPSGLIDGKKTLNIRYEKSKNGQTANVFFYEDYIW